MTSLERICTALHEAGVHYAVVGGYAVALHGAVRGTVDIDLAVPWTERSLVLAEAALDGIGLISALPVGAREVFAFRDEYVRNRKLIAWTFHNPDDPLEQVDIVINFDLTGKRTRRVELASGPVNVLSLPDLIAMKRESSRPQDIEDIRALEQLG